MTKKTLVVAGAGPGLGAAVARRFGREGFRVVLLSRSSSTFEPIVADLAALGIEAVGLSCDLRDDAAIRATFDEIKARFGHVDVLEYSPTARVHDMAKIAATAMTADVMREQLPIQAFGAITCVNQVLDDMLARHEGTIIISTAGSASLPVPSHAAIGAAMGVARMYALTLNAATRSSGVFVGTISLTVDLAPGSPVGDPDKVADRYYQMHVERDVAEVKIVDPMLMEVLEKRLQGIQAAVAAHN